MKRGEDLYKWGIRVPFAESSEGILKDFGG